MLAHSITFTHFGFVVPIYQIYLIENQTQANKLTSLFISQIAVIGVAAVFMLLPRFSQKVHLLYPES